MGVAIAELCLYSVLQPRASLTENTRISGVVVVVVVVVDSHIQRIVLAPEEITVTQQVSRRPIKNVNPACGHKEVRRSTGATSW